MVSLEQVKLLETKVARAIEYVERLTGENAKLAQNEAALLQREEELLTNDAELRRKEAELQAKLDSYQKRIDELEVLVTRFKEDQGRIEDGILSALDRLNQFEDAIEKSLGGKQNPKPPAAKAAAAQPASAAEPGAKTKAPDKHAPKAAAVEGEISGELLMEAEPLEDDLVDPLDEDDTTADGELDIF